MRDHEDGKVRYVNLMLEDVVDKIRRDDPDHAAALHRRYCDFWLVDGEMELNAPSFVPTRKRTPGDAGKPAQAASAETPRKRKARAEKGKKAVTA